MKLWACYGGFGLFVVRAETEGDARRVALDPKEGLGQYGGPGEYGVEEFEVEELPIDGPAAVLAEHYG
jgi:hypothetical protein